MAGDEVRPNPGLLESSFLMSAETDETNADQCIAKMCMNLSTVLNSSGGQHRRMHIIQAQVIGHSPNIHIMGPLSSSALSAICLPASLSVKGVSE